MTMLASAAVFADEEPQHVEEGETLALDCPMVDIRIQGGLTEMQPEVYTWEECGACQNVLKYKCNKNLSSIHLSGWGECEKYLRYIYNIVFFQHPFVWVFQRASFGRCQQGWLLTTTATSGLRC